MTLSATAGKFRQRGIDCRIFTDPEQVKAALLEAIKPDERVGMGGSMTLQELGVYELLTDRGNRVLWHWRVIKEEMEKTRQEAMKADVYLTSSNAVIEDGRLLNIDGTGNRVAAMFFGPRRVIVIAGRNKLSPDFDSALKRIQTVACPKNAERLKRDVPCRYTGQCQDCRSPDRMCQVTVTIANRLDNRSLEVWLVDRDLGY